MRKVKVEGCDAFVIKDNLVVIVDIEAECAVFTRLSEIDGVKFPNADKGIHFESPIGFKSLHKIYTADNELDLLIAALEA